MNLECPVEIGSETHVGWLQAWIICYPGGYRFYIGYPFAL